jgi:hypothetical protein
MECLGLSLSLKWSLSHLQSMNLKKTKSSLGVPCTNFLISCPVGISLYLENETLEMYWKPEVSSYVTQLFAAAADTSRYLQQCWSSSKCWCHVLNCMFFLWVPLNSYDHYNITWFCYLHDLILFDHFVQCSMQCYPCGFSNPYILIFIENVCKSSNFGIQLLLKHCSLRYTVCTLIDVET